MSTPVYQLPLFPHSGRSTLWQSQMQAPIDPYPHEYRDRPNDHCRHKAREDWHPAAPLGSRSRHPVCGLRREALYASLWNGSENPMRADCHEPEEAQQHQRSQVQG